MREKTNVEIFDIKRYGKPPEPTLENPYAQVEWIFSKRRDRCASPQAKGNYISAFNRYLLFLRKHHGNTPFYLREQWDEFALLKLRRVLDLYKNVTEDAPPWKSHTLVGFLSAVRQVMLEALSYGLLDCDNIHNSSIGHAQRETNAHADYSEKELVQIREAIASEMRMVYVIMAGYKPLAEWVGRDPRIKPRGIAPQNYAKNGYGWLVEANLQWYFENVMGAEVIPPTDREAYKKYRNFFQAASLKHGGIYEVYTRWGISPYVTRDMIMPLVVNLVYITGLNPTSLLNLKSDAYHEEHPLTGMPYLAFEKARSGGEKELHLALLDKEDEQPLKRKQALLVRKTFNTLLQLTSSLRSHPNVKPELKELLIIYQASSRVKQGEIIPLSPAQTSGWCRAMVKKYDLQCDEGEPLEFNLVRFRSTKLTQMALEGRDLFEIQQVARHSHIKTTLGYINRNRLDNDARQIVIEALQRIRENRVRYTKSCSSSSSTSEKPIKIYRGLISDCANVYDPPDRVKKSKDHAPGSPCTKFNMCLFCKNIILMREHLPSLALYRAQILTAQMNNIQNLPHSELYDRTLELLNRLFDPDNSEFSVEDIEWAVEMAESMDIVIDPLLYQGVANEAA